MLRQTLPAVEIIVVADGCTDGTQEAVAALGESRVKLLDLPKGFGIGYGNRDEALRQATGDVISWLADDDLYLPDHLAEIDGLWATGEADIVQATACVVNEDSSLTAVGMDWRVPYYRGLMLKGQNRTPASAVSHRPEAALSVGGWPERMRRRGDMDLWQRLLRAGARPVLSAKPTVLFFRATGREQPYAERVQQNRSFLERMGDERELVRIRSEMVLAAQTVAAREEVLRKRLSLGVPHLRARVRARMRLRELRKDRRERRDLRVDAGSR